MQQLGAAKNMDLQNAFALTPSRRNCRNCKNCPLSGRSRSFAGIKVQSCSLQSLSILCNKCHILFLFNVLFSHSQFVLFFCKKNIILLVFFMSYFHILYSVSTGTKIGRVKCNYSCNKMLNILKYERYAESDVRYSATYI